MKFVRHGKKDGNMTLIIEEPAPVSAVYEKIPLKVSSPAALHAWAVQHRYDASGVNLVPDAATTVAITPDINGRIPVVIERNNGGGTVTAIGRGNTTVPLRAKTEYIVQFSRLNYGGYESLNGRWLKPASGVLELIVDTVEGSSLTTQGMDSVGGVIQRLPLLTFPNSASTPPTSDLYPVTRGRFTTGYDAVGLGWGSNGAARMYFNVRGCKSVPSGWTFNVSSGAGWDLNVPASIIGNVNSFEILLTTGSDVFARQIVIDRAGVSNSYITIYVQDGYLCLNNRINIYQIQAVKPNTTYHIVFVDNNTSTAVGSCPENWFGVYVNGAIMFNTQQPIRVESITNFYAGATGASTVRNPFLGVLHHIRAYNKPLSKFAVAELWNGGKPWDYILPWTHTARQEVATAYQYGCVAEFLGSDDTYTASGDASRLYTIFSRVKDQTGIARTGTPISWGSDAPRPECSSLDPADGTESAYIIRVEPTFWAGKMMIYSWDGKYLPFQLSPEDIIKTYDSDDTNLPPVKLTVNTAVGTKTIALEQSAGIPGHGDFDLSGILKRCFFDQINKQTDYLIYDNRIYGSYSLTVGTEDVYNKQYIRQVQQYGFRHDISAEKPALLATLPCDLKRYEGYPLEIVAFNSLFASVTEQLVVQLTDVGGRVIKSTAVMNAAATISVDDAVKSIRLVFGGEARTYWIAEACLPVDPFYVRWINEMGGWDYFMFGGRRYIEDAVTDIVSIQHPERDNQYNTQETIDLSAYRYVEAGIEGLDRTHFDMLRKLGRSPRIQYWDEKAAAWFTAVLRKEASIKSESDTPTATVSYEFQLSPIRVQF